MDSNQIYPTPFKNTEVVNIITSILEAKNVKNNTVIRMCDNIVPTLKLYMHLEQYTYLTGKYA